MAPTIADLSRRNDLKNLSRRQRVGVGKGFAEGNKRGSGVDSGGGGGGHDGFGRNDGENGDDGEIEGDPEHDHEHGIPPSFPTQPPSPAAISTSVAQVISTAAASSSSIPNLYPALSTTPTLISSIFPVSTPTSILTSIIPFAPSGYTSSQPNKGLGSDDPDPYAAPTQTQDGSNTGTMLSDTSPSMTASPSLDLPAVAKQHYHDGLSPTSQHALIAFGAIGAFAIFLGVIYFIARMTKIDMFSKTRDREFSKRGPRSWPGSREREMRNSQDEPPPKYTGYDEDYEFASEQKAVPSQHQLTAFYSPTKPPTLATPESAAALSRVQDTQRRETVREALLDNPAPFGVLPAQPTEQSATAAFYNPNPSYVASSTYNPSQTYDSNRATRGLSRQNSEAYDAAQRQMSHISYLSSLSSGFGDQIIIPEPLPPKSNYAAAPRQSYRRSRNLSWATSARGLQDDRDTMYTTASIDSTPPRFRTVNSWVAQQVGHVQKQQTQDQIPAMPELPKPLPAGVDYQRNASEDLAFRHHPGDEIELSKGARIPSTILDKKFGIN